MDCLGVRSSGPPRSCAAAAVRQDGKGEMYQGEAVPRQPIQSPRIVVIPLVRIVIDGVVYTVEDTGKAVRGNQLDIYFDTSTKALCTAGKTDTCIWR